MIQLTHNGNTYELVVARKPLNIDGVYRICKGLDNVSLFLFVKHNPQGMYVIQGLGYFSLSLIDTDNAQDILVTEINGVKQNRLLFSDFISSKVGYKPELISHEVFWHMYANQAA